MLLKSIFSAKGVEEVSDLLPMSRQELSRLEVIQRVRHKTLSQRQAADLLALSVRQVKRLCRAYKEAGASALVSKRRGRPSNNRLPPETVGAASELLGARYHDFGPTLACEKLREVDGLCLGVESVRQLMIREGLWQRMCCKDYFQARKMFERLSLSGDPG